MLFNKQRYEFFSKSQPLVSIYGTISGCCSISKDTNFSANHNPFELEPKIFKVLFNKQRYEFFSKSQLGDYAAFEAGKKYVYSMRLTSESLPACVLPPFIRQIA